MYKLTNMKVEITYAREPFGYFAVKGKVSSVCLCCFAPWLLPVRSELEPELGPGAHLLPESSQLLTGSGRV